MKTEYKYIRIDCDNVGDKIELCLYELNTEKAQGINNLIRQSISELSDSLRTLLKSEILLIGPDDILLKIDANKIDLELLNHIKGDFFTKTGITLSIGIGKDIVGAMRNLDIAKKSGKNRIYDK
ncbi:MAG: mCpol domain-containing protein [Chitinophagales bacterium]|nr:mCpol domain-containing protein [Bacteroidota bacterium]